MNQNQKQKQIREPKTIDLTPTWAAVLPVYLAVLDNQDASQTGKDNARAELRRMAEIADKWVSREKTGEEEVFLNLHSLFEVYHGVKTGKTVFHAEANWTVESETAKKTLSVLGRGYTEREAVLDWTRRAQADGHKVRGIVLVKKGGC